MCGFMSVLCRYFCLCYVHFVLLVLDAVFVLVDCAVCSTLLAPLVAGASRPLGPLRGPPKGGPNCTMYNSGGGGPPPSRGGRCSVCGIISIYNNVGYVEAKVCRDY